MFDELNALWHKFSLFDLEESVLEVGEDVLPRPSNVLVLQFVQKWNIGVAELGIALKRIWRLTTTLKVTAVEDDIFLLEFASTMECNKIYFRQLWNFNSALLILGRL